MENTELIIKAMNMIHIPSDLVGNGRRKLKERLPEIVEHLVLESLGVSMGAWAEQSARVLRPDCHNNDPLYREGLARIYENLDGIYDFVALYGKQETDDMRRFKKYIWMYRKTTEHSDIKGICKEDATPKHF